MSSLPPPPQEILSFSIDPPEMDDFDYRNLEEILNESWTPSPADEFFNITPEEFFNVAPEEGFKSPEYIKNVKQEESSPPTAGNYTPELVTVHHPAPTTGNYVDVAAENAMQPLPPTQIVEYEQSDYATLDNNMYMRPDQLTPEEFFNVAPEEGFKSPEYIKNVKQEDSSPPTAKNYTLELVTVHHPAPTTGNYVDVPAGNGMQPLPPTEIVEYEQSNYAALDSNRYYMQPDQLMATLAAPPDFIPAAKQVRSAPEHGRRPTRKIRRWTTREHVLFLTGLRDYGNDWVRISKELMPTRSANQIASHAQKYFIRQQANSNLNATVADANAKTRKKRASIHDITIHHLPHYLPLIQS
ncbi:hypothetical protein V2J09_012867 [Rumex salicifolius]